MARQAEFQASEGGRGQEEEEVEQEKQQDHRYLSSTGMSLNPASHGFGESIAALQTESKAVRELTLNRSPLDRCQDQALNPA